MTRGYYESKFAKKILSDAISEINALYLCLKAFFRIPLLSWHTKLYKVYASTIPVREVMYLRWIIGHKIVGKVKFWEQVIMLIMIITSDAIIVLRSDRTMRWWMFSEFSSSCRTLNVSWVLHVSLCTVYKLQFFQGCFETENLVEIF